MEKTEIEVAELNQLKAAAVERDSLRTALQTAQSERETARLAEATAKTQLAQAQRDAAMAQKAAVEQAKEEVRQQANADAQAFYASQLSEKNDLIASLQERIKEMEEKESNSIVLNENDGETGKEDKAAPPAEPKEGSIKGEYKYVAIDDDEKRKKGRLAASSKEEAAAQLAQKGLQVVSLVKVEHHPHLWRNIGIAAATMAVVAILAIGTAVGIHLASNAKSAENNATQTDDNKKTEERLIIPDYFEKIRKEQEQKTQQKKGS